MHGKAILVSYENSMTGKFIPVSKTKFGTCLLGLLIFFNLLNYTKLFVLWFLNFQPEKKNGAASGVLVASRRTKRIRIVSDSKQTKTVRPKLFSVSGILASRKRQKKPFSKHDEKERLQVAMRGFNRSGTLDCSDCSSKVQKGQQHEGKSKSYLSILTASIFDWQLAASQLVFICPAFSPLLSKTSLILLQTRQFVSQRWVTKIESKQGFGLATSISVETLLQPVWGFSKVRPSALPLPIFDRNGGREILTV